MFENQMTLEEKSLAALYLGDFELKEPEAGFYIDWQFYGANYGERKSVKF